MHSAVTVSDFLHTEGFQTDPCHVIILWDAAATFRKNIETFGDEYNFNFRIISKWNK
jgi:hypothetical protein